MLRDQPMLTPNPERILQPEDVADTILHAVRLPGRADGERARHPPDQPLGVSPVLVVSMCVCRRVPFADLLPLARAAGWGLDELVAATGCGARLRTLPALPPAHARHRRDRVPRAAPGGRRE